MKHALFLAIGCALALTSCYKDDLDLDGLTTNPLDPDYNGPAVIEFVGSSTEIILNGAGLPIDTVHRQTVHVRGDLISDMTDWSVHMESAEHGISTGGGPNDEDVTFTFRHVVPGRTYCGDYSLISQFSEAKVYTYCSNAAL